MRAWIVGLAIVVIATGCGDASLDPVPTVVPTTTRIARGVDASPSAATPTTAPRATNTPVPAVPATSTATVELPTATAGPRPTLAPNEPVVFNVGDYPSPGNPFNIDGYDLVRRVGDPVLPNTPIDSVARSDGSIVVADSGVNGVLIYDSDWNLQQTVPLFHGSFADIPLRLALGPDDSVFVLTASDAVVRIDASGEIDPSFNVDWGNTYVGQASGIVVDSAGQLIVGPTAYGSLYRFDTNGDPVDVQSVDEECSGSDIAIDSSDVVYLLCRDVIRTFSPNGHIDNTFEFSEQPASLSSKATLSSIALDADDSMTLLFDGGWSEGGEFDTIYHDWTFARYDTSGALVAEWTVTPPGNGYYAFGTSISTDLSGNVLLPITAHGRIEVYDSAGMQLRTIAGDRNGAFGRVDRMTIDGAGNLYILDLSYDRVVKLSPSGDWLAEIPLPEQLSPSAPGFTQRLGDGPDLAVDEAGNVVIAGGFPARLFKLSPDGEILLDWDLHPNPLAAHSSTDTIGIDSSGIAYLLDTNGGAISRIDTVNASRNKEYEVEFDWEVYWIGMDFSIVGDTIYIAGSEVIPELEEALPARDDDDDDEDEETDQPKFPTVHRFDLDGRSLGRLVAFGPAADAGEGPIYVTADSLGNVYCMTWRMTPSDPIKEPEFEGQPKSEMMLRVFDSAGVLTDSGSLGIPGHAFQDLAVNSDGSLLYVTDPASHQVLVFHRSG